MRALGRQDGFAVPTALAVLVVVLGLGAALLARVNAQSNQTRVERAGEGSFQLAEGALNSQVLNLSRTWASSSAPYPTCTQATASSSRCIGPALAANYTGSDGAGGVNGGSDFTTTPTWSTRVIDDVDGSSYYSDSLATRTPAPCACDANGNGSVWVRADAAVGGRRSVVVSLVSQTEPQLEALPSASIIAGYFHTTNEGKKVIVDAQGASAAAGAVAVRCNSGPGKTDSCLGYDPEKGQLSPENAYQRAYVDGTGAPSATNRKILGDDALGRLKARALSLGTYFPTGCPATLSGPLVYIENPTNATCSYMTNTQYNSAQSPGVLILGGGQLNLGGTSNFYGLIYSANRQGSAPASGACTSAYQNPVVNLGGDITIHGAIMVDHCGGVSAGASGVNIVFDANVFANVKSNGTAASVKNTFRIVPAT